MISSQKRVDSHNNCHADYSNKMINALKLKGYWNAINAK